MSQTLAIPNFKDINVLTQTTIELDALAGVNSLTVNNCADFTSGSPVLVGALGSNGSELNTAGTLTSDTTLALGSVTKLPHYASNSVYLLFGTQIQVYSAPDSASPNPGTGQTPPDSAFSLVSGGTLNIDPTMSVTSFTDPTGSSSVWYKFCYLNSTTSNSTALSSSVAVRGDAGLNYCSLDDIRQEAGFANNPNITNALIDQQRQAAQNDVNGALLPVYQFPLPQPTNPIIFKLTQQLAAAYLQKAAYRSSNPEMYKQAVADEERLKTDDLNDLVIKRTVLLNAQFVEQVIPGGNGAVGYPDNTLVYAGNGVSMHDQGGPARSIFYPGQLY